MLGFVLQAHPSTEVHDLRGSSEAKPVNTCQGNTLQESARELPSFPLKCTVTVFKAATETLEKEMPPQSRGCPNAGCDKSSVPPAQTNELALLCTLLETRMSGYSYMAQV